MISADPCALVCTARFLCPVEMITPTPRVMPGTSTLEWDSFPKLLNNNSRLFPKSLEALGITIHWLFPWNSCCFQFACSSAGRLRSTAKASVFWPSCSSKRHNAFRGSNQPSAMSSIKLYTLYLLVTRFSNHHILRANCQLAKVHAL
jgi:hypothetical protein